MSFKDEFSRVVEVPGSRVLVVTADLAESARDVMVALGEVPLGWVYDDDRRALRMSNGSQIEFTPVLTISKAIRYAAAEFQMIVFDDRQTVALDVARYLESRLRAEGSLRERMESGGVTPSIIYRLEQTATQESESKR